MRTINALAYPLNVDTQSKTLRPVDDHGDEYFGLAPLTNGTAAACRRACVEVPGFKWVSSSGRTPTALLYVVP